MINLTGRETIIGKGKVNFCRPVGEDSLAVDIFSPIKQRSAINIPYGCLLKLDWNDEEPVSCLVEARAIPKLHQAHEIKHTLIGVASSVCRACPVGYTCTAYQRYLQYIRENTH